MSVLNAKQVRSIKTLLKHGYNSRVIGSMYGVHHSTIEDIKNGLTHNPKRKLIAKEIQRKAVSGEKNHWAKLTAKEVKRIRKYLATGNYTNVALGNFFNVSPQLISLINTNKIWKGI